MSIVRILNRRKWLIIGLAILGVLCASAYAFTARNQYTATAQLLVEPQSGTAPLTTTQQTITPVDVATELQLLQNTAVQNLVEKSLHFLPTVTFTQNAQTDVISVSAQSTSPSGSVVIANTYAKDFVTYQTQQAVQNLTAAELQYQQEISALQAQLGTLSVSSPGALSLGNQESVLKGQLTQLQIYGASTTGGVRIDSAATLPTSPSSP